MRTSRGAVGMVAGLVLVASPLDGQARDTLPTTVTDSIPADSIPDPDAPGNCTLMFEPIEPNTRALLERDGPETHINYLSGRYLWTCGNATMEADSAVKYDRFRRVELYGNVVYRDSIRTLRSELLDYFEIQDLVVATQDVELVRLVDDSRLTGPHVEFLRAVSGVDELTTATGRPHMTFYPEGEEPQEPFEVDADRAVFAGENQARFFGQVVLDRSDLQAEADSAYLTRDDGTGLMWGEPWVETEEVRLEGDTIQFRSEDDELKDVHSQGRGFASGEQFEVRAELIDIELENEEVDRLWAHGEGMSEAVSGQHLLYGDSLRFALFESQIDTVFSVGEAVAIQGGSSSASARLAGMSSLETQPDSVPTIVSDSLAPVVSDSILPVVTDSLALIVSDSSVAEPVADLIGEEPELMARVLDSAEAGEGETPEEGQDEADDSGGIEATGVGSRLSTDGSTNWVRGDTLVAVFERPGRPSPPDSTVVVPSAAADSLIQATPAPTDSSELVEPEAPGDVAADSTADPLMEQLIVVGSARAFYRQVRDSTVTDRPSRNYMIGSRIRIQFEDGEPKTVFGQNAIGVYLEPEESVQTSAAPTDSTPSVAVDSVGQAIANDSTTAADSTANPTDTTRVSADSAGTDPDTLSQGVALRSRWTNPHRIGPAGDDREATARTSTRIALRTRRTG